MNVKCEFQPIESIAQSQRLIIHNQQIEREPNMPMKTLVQFINEKQSEYPEATGDLTRLLNDIGIAAKL